MSFAFTWSVSHFDTHGNWCQLMLGQRFDVMNFFRSKTYRWLNKTTITALSVCSPWSASRLENGWKILARSRNSPPSVSKEFVKLFFQCFDDEKICQEQIHAKCMCVSRRCGWCSGLQSRMEQSLVKVQTNITNLDSWTTSSNDIQSNCLSYPISICKKCH